jgi:hypothetical protein
MDDAKIRTGRTDDRGVYRISGNLPGQFYVFVPSPMTNVPASAVTAFRGAATGPLTVQTARRRAEVMGAPVQPMGDLLLQYRPATFFALPPVVRADGSVLAYPTTFHPGATTVAGATPVVVAIGEERTGVDIDMRRVPMTRVSGALLGPSGPEPDFVVRLVSTAVDAVGGGEDVFESARTLTDAAGRFTFVGVGPGSYSLKADAGGSSGARVSISGGTVTAMAVGPGGPMGAAGAPPPPTLWAETHIEVGDAPVPEIALQLSEAPAIRGRVEFEGTGPRPLPNELRALAISFAPADGRVVSCCPATRVEPDGQFHAPGHLPGKYFVAWTNMPRWQVKSITARVQDIIGAPLTIGDEPITDVVVTLVTEPSAVSGDVVGPDGRVDGEAAVVIFPVTSIASADIGVNTRVVRLARPSPQTGAFSFANVIRGDCFIAATADDDLPNWQEGRVLRSLAQFATRITVAPGDRQTVRLVRGDLP